MPCSLEMRNVLSSGSSGRLRRMVSRRAFSISIGLTSVSGYMRPAPGNGRLYTEVPSGRGSRVSSGTPIKAWLALATAASNAGSARSAASAHRAKASPSRRDSSLRIVATSSAVMPYAGSSSEWNIPATPRERACWAISAPSLSLLSGLRRTPAKSGRAEQNTLPPLDRAEWMTLERLSLSSAEMSLAITGTGTAPLSWSILRISIRERCLSISLRT
ncbi:hypothetical protein DSECCO2_571440 [anaerobic digester metagenome]